MTWRALLLWAWVILVLSSWLAVVSLLGGCTFNACKMTVGNQTGAPVTCDGRR